MNKEEVANAIIELLFTTNEQTSNLALFYKSKILENEISSDVLILLNEADIKELGFEKLGHRKRVMQWIETLKQTEPNNKKRSLQQISTPSQAVTNSPTKKLKKDASQATSTAVSFLPNFQKDEKGKQTLSLPFTCPICYDSIEKEEDVILLDCSHLFCKSCILNHLQENLRSKTFPILCPFISPSVSKHEISQSICENLLSKNELAELASIQLNYAVEQNNSIQSSSKKKPNQKDASSLPLVGNSSSITQQQIEEENPFGDDLKFCYCPTPDCGYIFAWNEKEDDPHFRCDKCTKHYCLHCKVPFHHGMTCISFKKANINKNKDDQLFLRFIRQNRIKQCPQCMRFVEKRGGCNSITCLCGNVFCYLCGKREGQCTCGGADHEMPITSYAWRNAPTTLQNDSDDSDE